MVEPLLGVGEVGHFFFLKGGMVCFSAGKEGRKGGGGVG